MTNTQTSIGYKGLELQVTPNSVKNMKALKNDLSDCPDQKKVRYMLKDFFQD